MKETRNEMHPQLAGECGLPPNISASKIGLVSRDYNNDDFSSCFEKILRLLDEKGCDTALFSLYTILELNKTEVLRCLEGLGSLENLKNIFVEYYSEIGKDALGNVVYSKSRGDWQQYSYWQVFGSRNPPKTVLPPNLTQYVVDFPRKRIMGNVAVVLCGETNIVKLYRKREPNLEIEDDYNFLKVVPEKQIIFNSIHDRMTRPEMKKKRKFLSKEGRWVLSVWNKGKKFKIKKTGESKTRNEEKSPPWTVFHNGGEVTVKAEALDFGANQNIMIGIVDTTS